jgi:hypothetical protein
VRRFVVHNLQIKIDSLSRFSTATVKGDDAE